ncbi:hypothetical protein GCM10018793_28050 [Streptomyces sulfonofaciens]|uniref:MaoC-like domain-containing protein n=1 Tax=Streptomyces sulfonofaciens TaxID=68272 RepID=A0A919G5K4_9ACTN|nr:hypothetical protein GCM10018793_28050 [Streptomyces sulfonofaciens]
MLVQHLIRGAVLAPLKRPGADRAVPAEPVVADGVRVAAGRLDAYREVCGFAAGGGTLPVTYPQVLAFAPSMRLMSSWRFPLPLPGLVHTSLEIRQSRDLGTGEEYALAVRVAGLTPHRRGTEAHLVTEVRAAGEPVWQSRSTYLARHATPSEGPAPGHAAAPGTADGSAPPLPRRAEWRLGGDLGRRYAAVSGDRNPIHLHPLTARAFGFPRAVAHGMWSVARCLAEHGGTRGPVRITARFLRPVLLPATVAYAAEGAAFALRGGADGARPHVTGEVRPLDR